MEFKYRGYIIDKIDHRDAWRVRREGSEDTVVYLDGDCSIKQVKEDIDVVNSLWRKVMNTDAQKRATEKYQRANIRRVVIKLNKNKDQDLIERTEYLKSVKGSIQAEIMEAWREYLKKE